jgi:hypothetical protein
MHPASQCGRAAEVGGSREMSRHVHAFQWSRPSGLMRWCASQKQGMVSYVLWKSVVLYSYIHSYSTDLPPSKTRQPHNRRFLYHQTAFLFSWNATQCYAMHSFLHFPKPISTQSPQHSYTLVSIGKIKTLLFPLFHFSIRLLASFLGFSQGLAQGTSLLKKNKTVVNEWEVYNEILQTTMCVSFNL